MRRYVGTIIVVLVILGLAYIAFRPQPVLVEMGPVERATVREYVAEEARTQLAREYTVDMPESGELERIALEVGDTVQAGDVIARVNAFDLEQQIAGVNALIAQVRAQTTGVDVAKPKSEDLESAALRIREAENGVSMAQKDSEVARAQREQAEREFARVNGLLQQGFASPADRDAAQTAATAAGERAESAEIAVAAAQKSAELARLAEQRLAGSVDDNEYQRLAAEAEIANLETQKRILENKLEKTLVRAPVTGPVMEKHIEDSRMLAAGTPLLKIGDLASIEIAADILSEEVGQIAEGDAVELLGKAIHGENASGKVRRIHPAGFTKLSSLGIEQQRVRVLVESNNEQLQLRPGTRLDVRIITDESADTLAIPERATFRREGEHYVFVAREGRAKLTPVKLGLRNDTWAELLEGVDLNDTVIFEPGNDLTDNALVAAK